MFDRVDSSVTSETLKTAFFNVLLELVPYRFSISLEGTVGITIDDKQMLFLHFSDTVNKSSEDDAVAAGVKSSPPHARRNSVCGRRPLGNELSKIRVAQSNCTNGGTRNSFLPDNLHPMKSTWSSEDVVIQSTHSGYLAVAEACSELPVEKSTAARRKSRPAKFPSNEVTVLKSVSSNHVSNVCPVTGEVEIEVPPQTAHSAYVVVEPGGLEVLDFSTHGKTDLLLKRNASDFSVAVNENPKCSSFQMCSLDAEEIENAPMKASANNQQDQTLLRQLLLFNTKTKNATPSKRRLSGSDDDSNKRSCGETFVDEKPNGLLVLEPDACTVGGAPRTAPSHKSTASKRTNVKNSDDFVSERRANPESILCRLLTSGVNMYDTTEVERLRRASMSKLKATSGNPTASELGNAVVDLMLTSIKTEREPPCFRTDELVNNTPVENSPLCFQSGVRCHVSDSPMDQVSLSVSGPLHLKSLPDAASTAPPQLQTNCSTAEQCLFIVKKERGDESVDVHRTLSASADTRFPSDALPTKEKFYKMCFEKSSDFGK